MTVVKIEAHGHLGDFSKEYFIPAGKEFEVTRKIMYEFYHYVSQAVKARYEDLFKMLEELAEIERKGAEKKGDVHENLT